MHDITITGSCIVTGSPSPPKCSPVDERQRLASVSYVNYGPTTINGLTESQTKEIFHKPREGTGEMLRLTLEDGFKTMFLNSQSPLGQAIQANARLPHAYHKYQTRPNLAYQQTMFNFQQNAMALSEGGSLEWPEGTDSNGKSKFSLSLSVFLPFYLSIMHLSICVSIYLLFSPETTGLLPPPGFGLSHNKLVNTTAATTSTPLPPSVATALPGTSTATADGAPDSGTVASLLPGGGPVSTTYSLWGLQHQSNNTVRQTAGECLAGMALLFHSYLLYGSLSLSLFKLHIVM